MGTNIGQPTQVPDLLTGGKSAASEEGLVQTSFLSMDEPLKLGEPLTRLPVELEVAIPIKEFRVRHLVALEVGQAIETRWCGGEDLPLAAGEVQLAWTEFEASGTKLSVRLTRLA